MKRYLQAVKQYKNAYATMTECYREAQEFAKSFVAEQAARIEATHPRARDYCIRHDTNTEEAPAIRIDILHRDVYPNLKYAILHSDTNEWLLFKDYDKRWQYLSTHDVGCADAIAAEQECSHFTVTFDECGLNDIFFPDFDEFEDLFEEGYNPATGGHYNCIDDILDMIAHHVAANLRSSR